MLFDSHVHFDGLADIDGAIARAVEAGVEKMLAVGGARKGNELAVELAGRFPGRIGAAVGFDRSHAGQAIDIAGFESFARSNHVVAIGEIGLDYHYNPDTAAAQKELLGEMLAVAGRLDLPVILHSREADADTLELLGQRRGVRGVVHCFTGDRVLAAKLIELGLFISFSGIVTFKNAVQVRETVRVVPDDRLLIETDSPYLAPEPHRGKKNEPAYVKRVAEMVADLRGCTVEKIAEMTSANAIRLFSGPGFAADCAG